ncbi:MAG: restriction endonuclease subunit S [Candidatus Ruminococcus intestinipullorum]|nr:restriction endonuclease subunit S [Candidatus Ruminococcus intestinipullorum]
MSSYYEKIGSEVICIDDEILFDIPENWTWCRLSHIAEIIMGSSPSSTDICYDKQYTEFHQGKMFFTDRIISCSSQYTKSITKISPPNSVLLCVRAPVGEVNFTNRMICIGRGLASLKPYDSISEKFIFYWLQGLKSKLVEKATGTTFIAVTTDVVRNLLIPLPPYSSQLAIIKTIDEVIYQLSIIEKSLN